MIFPWFSYVSDVYVCVPTSPIWVALDGLGQLSMHTKCLQNTFDYQFHLQPLNPTLYAQMFFN
jgi:hypothetical protein